MKYLLAPLILTYLLLAFIYYLVLYLLGKATLTYENNLLELSPI